jgi:hypothetical protein
MKKYNPIYYLLFIMLVMGAFASMAQNTYGLKIMGCVAFVLGLVFLIEFISVLRKKDNIDVYRLTESFCLFLLSLIFALRIFYIHFPYVELLFAAAGLLLAMVYVRKMLLTFRRIILQNRFLAFLVLAFHLSIVLFLFSLVIVPFSPMISEAAGISAFVLLLGFIITGLLKTDLLVDGEKVSAFTTATRFKDHSIVIVSLFLLFSLYIGFNRIGILPPIYSDEFPQAYYNLIDKAAARKENPVDGRYRYQDFKDRYDEFLQHNSVSK